jgi:hypothetical protein
MYPSTEVRGTTREMEIFNLRHVLTVILLGRFDKGGFRICRKFQNEVESQKNRQAVEPSA